MVAELDSLVKIGGPIASAMAGALAVLWRAMHRQMIATERRVSKKLKDCEDRHVERDLWALSMSEKIGRLEGLMEGHDQAREDLRDLSSKVIEIIHKQEG